MSTMSQTMITPAIDRKLKNRVSLGQVIQNSLLMAYRGLLKFRRTPEQFFDVTLQPIIFTLLFTYIFGGAIAGDVQSYLPFFIPGILVQTVLTTSAVTGTQLREDMDKGVFDRFKSLPIARIAPLAGPMFADLLRYTIATTLTFTMGFIMGYRPDGGALGVLAAVALIVAFGLSLSLLWAALALVIHDPAVDGRDLLGTDAPRDLRRQRVAVNDDFAVEGSKERGCLAFAVAMAKVDPVWAVLKQGV